MMLPALQRKIACGAMSALPPKADMCGAARDVRFVPIADIAMFIRSPHRRAAGDVQARQGLAP